MIPGRASAECSKVSSCARARPPLLIRLAAWLAGKDNAGLQHEWLDHLSNLSSRHGDHMLSDEFGFVWTGIVVRLRSIAERYGRVNPLASGLGRSTATCAASMTAGFTLSVVVDLAAGKVFSFLLWIGLGTIIYWGETRAGEVLWLLPAMLADWLEFELNLFGYLAFWTGTSIVFPMSRNVAFMVILWGAGSMSAFYLSGYAVWRAARLYRLRQSRYMTSPLEDRKDP